MNSNREMDTFVGLRCNDGDISINFPLGYHISEDDNELRKDIMLLLSLFLEKGAQPAWSLWSL